MRFNPLPEIPMYFTAVETAEKVYRILEEKFPGVVFAVRLDTPVQADPECRHRSMRVVWADGPSREEVEQAVERFQGIEWDPQTGLLRMTERLLVDDKGRLVSVQYGVDYIFCEGPVRVAG